MEDQFFALEPQAGEGSAAFVVRAEVARRKLGVDSGQAYHAFAKRFLDENLKQQLDQVRWAKKASGNPRWGWEDIVTVCKDVYTGCALGKPPVATPTVGQPAAQNKPGVSPSPQGHKPARKCEI